jgi:hypothetical protein
MTKPISLLCVLLCATAGCVGLVTPSSATTLTYTLENVTDGLGDNFTGTFDFDTVAGVTTSLNITFTGPNTVDGVFFGNITNNATEQHFFSFHDELDLVFSASLASNPIGTLDSVTASSTYINWFFGPANITGGVIGAAPLRARSPGPGYRDY